MQYSLRNFAILILLLASSIPEIVVSQQPEGSQIQPEKPVATLQKTISREELKRLIAEKLAAKADPELIKLLLDQARAGEKRSLDPLANREDFEKLLLEMEESQKITAKVRKDTVGDLVDQSPTDPIEIVVNQTVNRLKARLGGDSQGVLETPEELSRSSIPEYADTPLLMEKVNSLLKTQVELRATLANETSQLKAGELDEVVGSMILAQEELVWEAAWPYTGEEVSEIRKNGGKIPREVYLSRLKRGLATVNEKVAEERTSVGRGLPARLFVLYRFEDSEASKSIDARLLDLRGHADAWKELAVPFDAEARNLLSKSAGRSD